MFKSFLEWSKCAVIRKYHACNLFLTPYLLEFHFRAASGRKVTTSRGIHNSFCFFVNNWIFHLLDLIRIHHSFLLTSAQFFLRCEGGNFISEIVQLIFSTQLSHVFNDFPITKEAVSDPFYVLPLLLRRSQPNKLLLQPLVSEH